MLTETVKNMPWTNDFLINHESRTVQLSPSRDDNNLSASCTTAFSNLVQRIIDEDTFRVVHGMHSEPYAIVGANFPVSLERYACTLFGIISRGAHLTAYTKTVSGTKIWVPRRSPNLFTYPNCLDTTVAGGVAAGERPFECIVREANEEASLSEELVRKQAVHCGCLSYVGLNDPKGGGETGLIAPDIIYVYDLELPKDVVCTQNDEEVKEFYLMTIGEVRDSLARAEFKTNSALVMIDFFIRHGIITSENEKDYAEIVARLHRRLPLPTAPQ
jgi:8-oxo-dGTP pyrophosphatase MutT (NUDIX family)